MICALLAFAFAGPDPGLPPRTHKVLPREVFTLEARDGVQMRTVMYRPKTDEPVPTVFTRVPYAMGPVLAAQCRILARRGHACGWQEVRGRLKSGGSWLPFLHEEADGQDAIAWIRAQPWSDQQVAWIGDSYLAAAGWTVALEDPDGLSTLISRNFGPPLYPSAFEDGLLRHELATAWMALMPASETRFLGVAGPYHKALQHRPRTEMDVIAAGQRVDWFRAWIRAEDPTDPFWTTGDPARFEAAADTTNMPVLFVGGWSDTFIEAELDAWSRLPRWHESLLVIGPWTHLGQVPSTTRLKGVRGPGGGGGLLPQLPRVVDWLNTHLQGAEPRYDQTGAVTYVVGGNRWVQRDDWPPPVRERRFGITKGSGPCDGTLSESAGPLEQPLTYVYDPENPLPSRGGAGLLAGAIPFMNGVRPGFVRSPVHCEDRTDVLQFETLPFDTPLHLAGTLRVELEVSSDAEDSAFGFRLLERRSNGTTFILREGFATLALRGGSGRHPYKPDTTVFLEPDGQPLEAEVQVGSSLILVLTSASFPAVEAHPNVAGILAEATETRTARQRIHSATLVVPEVLLDVPAVSKSSELLAFSNRGTRVVSTFSDRATLSNHDGQQVTVMPGCWIGLSYNAATEVTDIGRGRVGIVTHIAYGDDIRPQPATLQRRGPSWNSAHTEAIRDDRPGFEGEACGGAPVWQAEDPTLPEEAP